MMSSVGRSTAKKASTARPSRRRTSPGKEQLTNASKFQQHLPHYNGVVNLNDPTSVTMQSSFLIKNHALANFDNYLMMMKKRKTNLGGNLRDCDSPMLGLSPYTKKSTAKKLEVCGTVKGKAPAARDGHSAAVFGEQMIIFGGDRHRMPFADTYSLNIKLYLHKNLI